MTFTFNLHGEFDVNHTVTGDTIVQDAVVGNNKKSIEQDIGIGMPDGTMSIVIPRGSSFPCTITKEYSNSYDNQTLFAVPIYQGNNKIANQNTLIREHIIDMNPCPRGTAIISVTFTYNLYGDFDV